MKAAHWKELLALTMVGDGVLTAIQPKRHLRLWRGGPKFLVRTIDAFEHRPTLTRILGISKAVAGLWWASRQRPERSFRFLRRSA
jgi:hypothetical protein